MITSQIIKNCLEDLCAITHTQFCVQDLNGNIIAATPEAEVPDAVIVSGFANLPVDSQIILFIYSRPQVPVSTLLWWLNWRSASCRA